MIAARQSRGPEPWSAEDRRIALWLGLAALIVFNANFRSVGSGDSFPARILPFCFLQHHTVYLDPLLVEVRNGSPAKQSYWVRRTPAGRWASLYPIVTPILVTPLYVPAAVMLQSSGWDSGHVTWLAERMEKLSATIVASLTTLLLYPLLRRRASRSDAVLLTIAFAFGTNTWVTASQALWQHGPAQLFAVLALIGLTSAATGWWPVILAGFASGVLVANRPPDAFIAGGIALAALVRWRWRWLGFAAAAIVPAGLELWYNMTVFRLPLGGYQFIGVLGGRRFLGRSALEGVAGLLVSPTHGLLVFSPFLIFLVFLFVRPPHQDDRVVRGALMLGIAGLIAVYAKTDWRGGHSFGPRFLTDAIPVLTWLLTPVVSSLRRPGLNVFRALCGVGIVVQLAGAFFYQGYSDLRIYQDPRLASFYTEAWKVKNSPLIADVRMGPAKLEFAASAIAALKAHSR